MKELLFILFTLLATLPITVNAQHWSAGIRFRITGANTAKVIACSDGYSGDINIPSTVSIIDNDGYGDTYEIQYQITAIDDGAFRDCSRLNSVTIPNTVKTIGKNAFYNCAALAVVEIPNSVRSIGANAFGYCTGLRTVTIPQSVHEMGWNAFYCCTGLTSVNLTAFVTELNGTFKDCSALIQVTIPNPVIAIDGAFTGCSSLSSVTLPEGLMRIGTSAFEGCTALATIDIPATVSAIDERAFANSGLTSLTIPATVTSLGQDAWLGCDHLTSITSRPVTPPAMGSSSCFPTDTYMTATLIVPSTSLTTYRSTDWWNLFNNIQGRTTLNTPYDFEVDGIYYVRHDDGTASVTYHDNNYNSYSGNVTVPATVDYNGITYRVTGIGNHAFDGCTALTSVTLPTSIINIGEYAFNGSGVNDITIPQGVEAIGNNAFSACQSLSQLTWDAQRCMTNGNIPTSIASVNIGDEVEVLPAHFVEGSLITSITIPSSVKSIGDSAFMGCTGLTSLVIPESVNHMGNNAFSQCSGVTALTWNATECQTNGNLYTKNIQQVTIGENVKVIPSNFIFQSKVTAVVIPDAVTSIEHDAFSYCDQLTDVTVGKSVTNMYGNAFSGCRVARLTWNAKRCWSNGDIAYNYIEDSNESYGSCSIEEVTIGNEVEVLPRDFVASALITTVSIPQSVKYIGGNAFSGCRNLTEINIPSTVKHIGNFAFAECENVSEITIPDDVTVINQGLFYKCTHLTNVNISDRTTSIGALAFGLCISLKEIDIPGSVAAIGSNAFINCSGLTDMTCRPSVPPTATQLFNYADPLYDKVTLHVPVLSIADYQADNEWKKFTNITAITDEPVPGDINNDGTLDVDDVIAVISMILNNEETPSYADINQDGSVDINDITALIDMLLKAP